VARIDPARRAEIGRAKSARTREQILGAARSLYARQAVEAVTVEDVVREAGVAKGTLYVHFKNIEAVQMAVADELTQTFVDLLEPRRAIFENPIERIADGCCTFLSQATLNPRWGGLVARYAWCRWNRSPGDAVRERRKCAELRCTVRRHRDSAVAGGPASRRTCRCEARHPNEIELVNLIDIAHEKFSRAWHKGPPWRGRILGYSLA
jgi:AcrR family transcriptional regulator